MEGSIIELATSKANEGNYPLTTMKLKVWVGRTIKLKFKKNIKNLSGKTRINRHRNRIFT